MSAEQRLEISRKWVIRVQSAVAGGGNILRRILQSPKERMSRLSRQQLETAARSLDGAMENGWYPMNQELPGVGYEGGSVEDRLHISRRRLSRLREVVGPATRLLQEIVERDEPLTRLSKRQLGIAERCLEEVAA